MITFAEWYMRHAQLAACKSKDSTRVGAALISPEGVVCLTSYNGPPRGVHDRPERRERPAKYLYSSHSEANLVAFAARLGIQTAGCTVYTTHTPCASGSRSTGRPNRTAPLPISFSKSPSS